MNGRWQQMDSVTKISCELAATDWYDVLNILFQDMYDLK